MGVVWGEKRTRRRETGGKQARKGYRIDWGGHVMTHQESTPHPPLVRRAFDRLSRVFAVYETSRVQDRCSGTAARTVRYRERNERARRKQGRCRCGVGSGLAYASSLDKANKMGVWDPPGTCRVPCGVN